MLAGYPEYAIHIHVTSSKGVKSEVGLQLTKQPGQPGSACVGIQQQQGGPRRKKNIVPPRLPYQTLCMSPRKTLTLTLTLETRAAPYRQLIRRETSRAQESSVDFLGPRRQLQQRASPLRFCLLVEGRHAQSAFRMMRGGLWQVRSTF